ncbi:2-oxoacid:acceptor oxidoreductase family protein [bacterium]|nr:2-oxoacid:acceptor oxidoreductase family protein [bacterium]
MKNINIVFAGLGGQGVLRASDITAEAAFLTGFDVKKAEVHGMSQRGGSVSSDVRFGSGIKSPMIPAGTADFLVLLDASQKDPNALCRSEKTVVIEPDIIKIEDLPNPKGLNVALLGYLSTKLPEIPEENWQKALENNFPEKLRESNTIAFNVGRETNAR